MILKRIWKQSILSARYLKGIKRSLQSIVQGMELTEIVRRLEGFAPLSLAESWDNVGVLVEPSTATHFVSSILVTIDLTEAVMTEAIQKNTNMILSYHPPIFAPLKSLTKKSWKERVILKAIENKIAIYSPHTAFDAVKGGVNDWLANGLGEGAVVPLVNTIINGAPLQGTGIGRLCTLDEPVTASAIIERVKNHLKLENVRFAFAQGTTPETLYLVKTIAICAGSGGSVLKGIKADMYLTGEMSHHDILDAIGNRIHVVLCEHSNTERGFFKDVFCKSLFDILEGKVAVDYSTIDTDPLCIV